MGAVSVLAQGILRPSPATAQVPDDGAAERAGEPADGEPEMPATERVGASAAEAGCDGDGTGVERATRGAPGPWSHGVSAAQQREARARFCTANALRKRGWLELAAAEYQAAIELWPHPAFWFNLALVLRAMPAVAPLDVYTAFENARAHGAAPIGDAQYRKAEEYMAQLMLQLARLEVICDEPDAIVYLNGKPLFQGPGRHQAVLEPGLYHVTATKAGHHEAEALVGLSATVEREVALVLPREQPPVSRRVPLVVGLAGVAVLGAGAVMHWQAARRFDDIDRRVDAACSGGCDAGVVSEFASEERSARRLRGVAIAGYAVGGAALAAAAWLWLRGRRAEPRRGRFDGGARGAFVPALIPDRGPGWAGVTVRFSF